MVPNKKKLRVAVLKGGPSPEHDVSLKSAMQVATHLDRDRYDVNQVLVSREGEWAVSPEELKRQGTDIAFIAMHGVYGEDGTVQSILDEAGLPYTGSNATTSALAMNKFLTARLIAHADMQTPLSIFISRDEWERDRDSTLDRVRYYIHYPAVVKPNASGSSVGVYIVHDGHELAQALINVFAISREALVQVFIEGREVTCAVLDRGTPESSFPLLPTEIVPRISTFFDYQAKYEPGGSDEITPADLREPHFSLVQKISRAVHRLVGARGFSRTDMIVNPLGQIFVLEINTIPGLTTESLLPKAAQASGISFPKLLDTIVDASFT